MRIHILNLLSVVIYMITLLSCVTNTEKQALCRTLEQAGEQRKELEKAISFYNQDKDSLKRKAMLFLLEHMYAHYTYSNQQMELTRRAFDVMDTLLTRHTNTNLENHADFKLLSSIIDSISQAEELFEKEELEKKWDNQTVTANFLIQNIEFAFRAWNTNPWAKNVDFKTFCEYILPYRLDKERIESWRPQFYNEYSRKAGKYRHVTSIEEASRLATSLHTQREIENIYPYSMDISAVNLLRMGRCYDIGRYRIMVLRSVGIPATLDYVPHWGNYSGEHGVVRLVTHKQEKLIENIDTSENISTLFKTTSFLQGKKLNIEKGDLPKGVEVQYTKTLPKVYRRTWSVCPARKYLQEIAHKDELIPNFQLCVKDVTSEYVSNSDVNIEIEAPNHRIGYLCVSERGEWIPIIAAEIKKNRLATFQNMGQNVMYLPAVYENKRIKPAGSPFYINTKGNICQIRPQSTRHSIRLLAKYPYFSYTAVHAYDLKNSYFEVANREDFQDAEKLHTVSQIPFYRYKFAVSPFQKYRYIRFVTPGKKRCGLAELSFYGLHNDRDTILLSPKRFHDGVGYHALNVLKDKKYGKYYSMYTEQLTADLGVAQQLTQIELVPRSNTNGIIPKNNYELFYWSGNDGWLSLGKQTAIDWHLNYQQVPNGALLWLKCDDGGKEERIFTYKEGKQIWW